MPYSQLFSNELQPPPQKPPQTTTTDFRIYTSEEVKHHDKPDDLWMIIYNKVYNLSNFSKIHPGDVEVLLDCGGTDGTEAFEDVGHSDYAYQMLRPYLIGELPLEEHKKYENIPEFTIPETNPCTETRRLGYLPKSKKRKKKRRRKNQKYQFSMRIILLCLLAIISFTLFLYIQRFRWVSL